MRRATLIVNPHAGAAHRLRRSFPAMERVFARHDVSIQVAETVAEPGSARHLARETANRSDLIIACGGDGTVHGVLQGMANTSASLGVLPFGTANALARNLGLSADPVAALDKLLTYKPREIPLGVAENRAGQRWFTVMTGAGPDGRLIRDMALATKAQAGRSAYYFEAARLFLLRSFPVFNVADRSVGSERWRSLQAVAMTASRIPDLGGLFRGLTPESKLHHPHLVVKVLAAPACLSLPAWFALARSRLNNPWLTTLEAEEIRCSGNTPDSQIYAQVDGELFGTVPLTVTVESKGLRLLMPAF